MLVLLPWLSILVGLVVGSFLALVSVRLPAGESIVGGRSRCPACGHVLHARELVPLLSFAVQRARCAHCRSRISWRYPAMEFAAAAIGLVAGLVMGDPARAAVAALLGWSLLLLAVLDAEHFWLPRAITLPLGLCGLAASLLDQGRSPLDRLLGAVLGWAVFAAFGWIYQRLRGRTGLGGGDAWLFGAGGAWVGAEGLPWVLLASSWGGLAFVVATSAWRRWSASSRLPFGSFLAPAIWLFYLLGV